MKDEATDLKGKAAIVTGGSGAIGCAILDAFEQAGVRAVSLDLLEPDEKQRWVYCDIREESSVIAAVESIYKTEGRLDFVVHAAGISRDSVIWKMSTEDWDSVQAVNIRGAFLLLRHAIPLLRPGHGGRIVLIGSINGSRGKFGASAYSEQSWTDRARQECRQRGRPFRNPRQCARTRVGAHPVDGSCAASGERCRARRESLGKFLEPTDVAESVLFLCGPGAAHITGQILRVDGGQFLGGA